MFYKAIKQGTVQTFRQVVHTVNTPVSLSLGLWCLCFLGLSIFLIKLFYPSSRVYQPLLTGKKAMTA